MLSFLLDRFLVAVDRRNGPEVAMETVKLAEDFMLSSDGVVVGLDLSGDPTVSTAWIPMDLFIKVLFIRIINEDIMIWCNKIKSEKEKRYL